jgi:hypothetical protein
MRPIVKPRWPRTPRDSAGHEPRQGRRTCIATDYYDPKGQPGIAEISVAKNRNGRIGLIQLAYFANLSLFTDLSAQAEAVATEK